MTILPAAAAMILINSGRDFEFVNFVPLIIDMAAAIANIINVSDEISEIVKRKHAEFKKITL